MSGEELKDRLALLGVSTGADDAKALAALFPPEFKIEESRLGPADLAKAYLAFVEHGLITPPNKDARLPGGTKMHVCHFYRSEDDSLSLCSAYLEEGLRADERCLWVVPAWLSVTRARAASRALRPALYEAMAAGRIAFLTDDQVHVDKNGAMRDARGIIDFWLDEERKALAAGFRGLRIAGDGTALVAGERWEEGVKYEHDCDAAFHGRRIVALCEYALKDVPAERLARLLASHAIGVTRRTNGVWTDVPPGPAASSILEKLR